jgi:CubicO group peptidase (beta-lactamase class C family)
MLAAVAVAQGRVSWTTTVGTMFPELGGAVRAEYRPVTLVGRILRLHQTGR